MESRLNILEHITAARARTRLVRKWTRQILEFPFLLYSKSHTDTIQLAVTICVYGGARSLVSTGCFPQDVKRNLIKFLSSRFMIASTRYEIHTGHADRHNSDSKWAHISLSVCLSLLSTFHCIGKLGLLTESVKYWLVKVTKLKPD